MTGKAGSVRYMAPEVARCEEYNLKVDTYSWSLIYWTCLTLEKPYADMDRSTHLVKVCRQDQRPSIRGLPVKIQLLLAKSWSRNVQERLSMAQVCAQLDSILRNLLDVATTEPTSACTGGLLVRHGLSYFSNQPISNTASVVSNTPAAMTA